MSSGGGGVPIKASVSITFIYILSVNIFFPLPGDTNLRHLNVSMAKVTFVMGSSCMNYIQKWYCLSFYVR